MPATTLKPRKLTWGDRFHLAYRQSRDTFGYGYISYSTVAERVSQIVPTSNQSILRMEGWEELPRNAQTRQVAFFALMALGFDPADFGLTEKNVPLGGFNMARARKLLSPGPIPK